MGNFSFSHYFFERLVQQTCKNQGLCGKGLRRVVVSEQWCLKASGLLIQVVSNTDLTVSYKKKIYIYIKKTL